jgi:phospholipid/cholesterol/gamma-HCH transport system substrate-binding protein
MDKSRLEIKVGLFMFVSLVLLALLLIQFSKGTTFFRGTYELRLRASDVGGLKPRTGVLLAGVQVGMVSDVTLGPDGTNVLIRLRIYRDHPIHRDAHFVIEQSGFLGDQYVSVIPTDNLAPVLTNGEEVVCEKPFNLQKVARSASGFIERVDDTVKKLDAAVADVRRLVLNEQTLTNLSVTVGHMRVASEHALTTVDRDRKSVV